jgi:ferredoxin
MSTTLYYCTGTGNSLWLTRMLAKELGDAAIVPIPRLSDDAVKNQGDAVGIIFPVHIWGVPHPIIAFVNSLMNDPSRYYFAVAVNAGQVAATLLQLKKLIHAKGLTLSSGFEIAMPNNYIPWGGPGPKDKQILRFTKAEEKVRAIADVVSKREQRPVERGPLWQNILFTWLNRLAFPHVPSMDKSFWVDEKCNFCGICKTVCPCGKHRSAGGQTRLAAPLRAVSRLHPVVSARGDPVRQENAAVRALPPSGSETVGYDLCRNQ